MEKECKKQNNGILDFSKDIKLLAILGHEDDEAIGCGGTLAKAVESGGASKAICFGGSLESRAKEFARACNVLGVEYETFGKKEGFYDTNERENLLLLRNKIIEYKPDVVITHRKEGDYHPDHSVVSDMARQATIMAQTPVNAHMAKGILYTETHSLHSIVNVFVDVTNQYSKVMQAMDQHDGQNIKSDGYYGQLIDKKSSLRGLQAGCGRAEAFLFEPLELIGSLNRRNLGA